MFTACHFPVAANNTSHRRDDPETNQLTISGLPLASETKESSGVQIYAHTYAYSSKNKSYVLESTACGITLLKHVTVIYSNVVDSKLCFS